MGTDLTYPEAIVIAAGFLSLALWITFGDLGTCIKDAIVIAAREWKRKGY